jgi:hypothetical protein
VRIFDPVKEHEKWLLPSRLRLLKNLLGRVVEFRGDERDHSLVVSARHQPIEGRRRFNVDGDPLCLGEMEKVRELSISSQHEQPLKRSGAGSQGLTHGMQTIDQFRLAIASTGWCRQACPR